MRAGWGLPVAGGARGPPDRRYERDANRGAAYRWTSPVPGRRAADVDAGDDGVNGPWRRTGSSHDAR
ncbi:hypothetical protein GCM10010469_49560 [Streptomyces labedae]|uniref:Uncharacterized protein n=1 Tax=Streptomyces labedae TaxID=285569 RepID=A0ABP6R3N0_9ACTN